MVMVVENIDTRYNMSIEIPINDSLAIKFQLFNIPLNSEIHASCAVILSYYRAELIKRPLMDFIIYREYWGDL